MILPVQGRDERSSRRNGIYKSKETECWTKRGSIYGQTIMKKA